MENIQEDMEKKFGHRFRNITLLEEALRHRSWVNEHRDAALPDNERLEFLGDAVLNLIVGHLLMQRYPDLPEGDLSRMRAALVNESRLAAMARSIQLGRHLHLGRGEDQTGGREKNSILADALEAVIAAVYLDGGYDAAFAIVQQHFSEKLLAASQKDTLSDYKSSLQEIAQRQFGIPPDYQVVDESGPDHEKTFFVRLTMKDMSVEGKGRSKKLAEQDAARKALEQLPGSIE
jgi:ribonuclease III